jgi:hypothetical protein
MTPVRYLVGASALAAVALSGCGSHLGAASSAQQAQLAVATATQKSQSTSLRYDLTATLHVDASKLTGVSAAELGKLAGVQTVTVTASAEQESTTRQRVTLTLKLGTETHTATLITYDGQIYYSLDGGGFEAGAAPKRLSGGLGAVLSQPAGYVDSLPGFQDKGTTQQDGLSVEKYEAVIDQSLIGKLFAAALAHRSGQASSAAPPQLATMLQGFLQQLVHVDSGAADVYVRASDGRLDRATVATALTVDLANLGPLLGGLQALGAKGTTPGSAAPATLPGGQLRVDINVDTHLYDYGASISVTKPAVAPGTSTSEPAAGLFG